MGFQKIKVANPIVEMDGNLIINSHCSSSITIMFQLLLHIIIQFLQNPETKQVANHVLNVHACWFDIKMNHEKHHYMNYDDKD